MTAALDSALDALTSVVTWSRTESGSETLTTWNEVIRHLWGDNSPAEEPTRLLQRCLQKGDILSVHRGAAEASRDLSFNIETMVVPGAVDLDVGGDALPDDEGYLAWIWHGAPVDLTAGNPHSFMDASSAVDPQNHSLQAVLVHTSDILIGSRSVRRTVLWPWVRASSWGTGVDVFSLFPVSDPNALIPGVPDVVVGEWDGVSSGAWELALGSENTAWETADTSLLRYVLAVTSSAREAAVAETGLYSRAAFRRAVRAGNRFPPPTGRELGAQDPSGGVLRSGSMAETSIPPHVVWKRGLRS